jgi:hypothetical protein
MDWFDEAVRLVEQNVCTSIDLFHTIEECRVAAEDNRPSTLPSGL